MAKFEKKLNHVTQRVSLRTDIVKARARALICGTECIHVFEEGSEKHLRNRLKEGTESHRDSQDKHWKRGLEV